MTQQYKLTEKYQPRNEREKMLVRVFASLKTEKEIASLLRDLLTLPEIEEFANRIEIVRMLSLDKPYLEIAKKTKVSTTTVTRVAQWLYRGCGGYKRIVEKIFKKP